MIKVVIKEADKEDIINLIWDDASKASTGLVNNLEVSSNKTKIKKINKKLYDFLYDNRTGKVNKDNAKKLLSSGKKDLEKYIDDFGVIDEKYTDFLLNNIFRYDTFSNRAISIKVLRKLKIDVCPYCNRQYIFTVKSGSVRAQLDHYLPKRKYPYLALSIFNLIPCCSICNTSKSDLDTKLEPILYPYDDEFGYDVSFNIKVQDVSKNYVNVIQGVSNKFEIIVNNPTNKNETVVNRQIDRLHLKELYNEHKPYVMDLLKNKTINSKERIAEIRKAFPALFASDQEVKNVLYMSDIRKENWHKRPLSKLTYDIGKSIHK